MKVAKEASPAEQPPLPQAPVGGASPVPEGPAPDPNAGGEFNDGDEDMGGEMSPMGDPQGGEGIEQEPMGDDMGTQEDSKLQVVKDIWSQLSDEDKDAGIKYLESMKDNNSQPEGNEGQEPMPPMDGSQEQMPMQEKVIFKKKQLEELMKRK